MPRKKSTSQGDQKSVDKKSLQILLEECSRLRQDLVALTTNKRPPPMNLEDSARIHGVVESRFREFEGAAKEEVKRLSQKNLQVQILREPPERKKKPPSRVSEVVDVPTKRRNRLSAKLIKGVNIYPEVSEEKLRSLELEQARPKSNVGYFHFVSREDQTTSERPRAHLVVQSIRGVHIPPEKSSKYKSQSQRLSATASQTTQCSSGLEEGSLQSTASSQKTLELEEGGLQSSSSSNQKTQPQEKGTHPSTSSHRKSQELEEGSLGSSESSATDCTSSSSEESSEHLVKDLISETNDHSQKSDFSSSQSKSLTEFLQKADKSLIERLPLDEKMKIIRRNLRTYDESANEGGQSDEEDISNEEEQSTDSLCDFLRYALSGKEGKAYLSTIEERTENESSSQSIMARRSLEDELRECHQPGKSSDSLQSHDESFSVGQYILKDSKSQDAEIEMENDDDDASSTDTFTVSAGEWNSLIY